MDERFSELAKAMASGLSRRDALRRLLGTAAGGFVTFLGLGRGARAQAQVTICHIPRGNPANAHTITVEERAVAAHVNHGDTLGPCGGVCVNPPICTASEGCCEGFACFIPAGAAEGTCIEVGVCIGDDLACDPAIPNDCCSGLCNELKSPLGAVCGCSGVGQRCRDPLTGSTAPCCGTLECDSSGVCAPTL